MLKISIAAASALVLGAAAVASVSEQVVNPKAVAPSANYSQGILVDGTLWVSGQAGEDAAGKIPPTFENEVQQALDNINAVLKEAGLTPADVVAAQVYLTRVEDFPKMNGIYTKFFPTPRPTRTTVVVARLVGEGHVEITVTA